MEVSNIIHSTAGAIPFINDKGDVSMQKVKVQRYITGKRPAYAPDSDQEISEDDNEIVNEPDEPFDLSNFQDEDDINRNIPDSSIFSRNSRAEPEIIFEATDNTSTQEPTTIQYDSDENDKDLDEQEISFRRQLIKQRLKEQTKNVYDVLDYEDEISEIEEQLSSEYEDYSDSDEEVGPLRLKPFFVKKQDRVTIRTEEEKDMEINKLELQKQRLFEERKMESHQILEEIINFEKQKEQGVAKADEIVVTDDENDEIEYEEWKLRELKRVKRGREEIERLDRERENIERIHTMDDKERKKEFEKNPRFIPNRQCDEKQYKFLQKYYHRGAFFLNKEEDVYKRDFSKPTLEDHFNKQVLPKVMQVKSFGRSGRTKYTHLLDQDTTQKDNNPWTHNDSLAIKYQNKGGGMKQSFERPTSKKQKLQHRN